MPRRRPATSSASSSSPPSPPTRASGSGGGHTRRAIAALTTPAPPSAAGGGERLGEVTPESRDSVLNSALAPHHYPAPNGGEPAVEFGIDPAKFHDAFAAGLPAG